PAAWRRRSTSTSGRSRAGRSCAGRAGKGLGFGPSGGIGRGAGTPGLPGSVPRETQPMLSLTLRQTAILILLFVVTSSGLILLDQGNRLDPIRTGAEQVLGPLNDSFNRLGRAIGNLGTDDSELARQLAAVTAERDQLLAENVRLRQLEQEVVQLREQ